MNALCSGYATRAVEIWANGHLHMLCSFDTLEIVSCSIRSRSNSFRLVFYTGNQHRHKESTCPRHQMKPIFCYPSSCIRTVSNVSLWKCLPNLLILCHLNPPNLFRLHPVLAGSIVSKWWQTKGSSRECHGEESKLLQEVWYQARADQSAENHDWP